MEQRKPYILAGAGKFGKQLLDFLGYEKVYAFYDGKKHGATLRGKKILGIEELQSIWQNYTVVLSLRNPFAIREVMGDLNQHQIGFHFLDEVCRPVIQAEAERYDALNTRPTFSYDPAMQFFVYLDRVSEAASIDSYFWQDLWAARRIYENRPLLHYDIGSRIDGFISHLATFGQRVRLLDIRPMEWDIPGVDFQMCDATNLDGIADGSIESLSALCSLEHFGLGRYGDPIDPEGCFKCFRAITKKLAHGGRAYISVPIGREHVEFNAHRVFYASTIVDAFCPLTLVEFSSSLGKEFERGIDIHAYDNWDAYGGGRFGLFEFVKS